MSFLQISKQKIQEFLIDNNYKSFHVKQIYEWIYKKKVSSFDEMTNLSIDLRKKLKDKFKLYSLNLVKCQISKNKQTVKFLFKLEDEHFIESVLILSKNRRTVCVSTQVGCIVKCSFCASGKSGFFRNLKSYEIIEQIIHISNHIKKKPTHIVFMGMGEPLLNLNEIVDTIFTISNDAGFNISQRRITISTVGILENIKKLKKSNLKINLALSLHAPNDEIRNIIIPFSKKYKLHDIIKELKLYSEKTKRDISFEYILIDNVNDSLQYAKELVYLLKNIKCSINLIPYNSVSEVNYKKPSSFRVNKFKNYLIRYNLNVSQRYTKGDDISAACGQLAYISKL